MVDGAAKGGGVTVPPKIRKRPPNRLEVLYWTGRLIEAEDARRDAERTYQQVLMRLRGAMKGAADEVR